MSRSVLSRVSLLACLTLPMLAAPARAADAWSDPAPGVRYLHRTTNEPKDIHALVVDLDQPGLSLRATRPGERGRTVTSFSNLVGAVAAVNADFYASGYDPSGLAIGEGEPWPDGTDSAARSFLACTTDNVCEIDLSGTARAVEAGWHSAVGGNQILVRNGVARTAAEDTACGDFCTTLHPRTAAGLSADGRTLILVVVEGRQAPLYGMGLARLGTLMVELGAHTAFNLDGGGSSAMVVDGTRVSDVPTAQGSERTVANHLAVLYDPDAATTGRLVGFIREGDIYDTEAALPGATVSLSTGESTTTDDTGFYEFTAVPIGTVTVTASLDGYEEAAEAKDVAGGVTNWKSLALLPLPPVEAPEPLDDAGVVEDAGSSDAGVTYDAGTGSDAGFVPDAGSADDAGFVPDAGSAGDAGSLDDAGTISQRDGGVSPDAGAIDAAVGCACSAPSRTPWGACGALALAALAVLTSRRRRRQASSRR